MLPHHIFLALGSNLGEKEKNIEAAYEKIEERIGKIVSTSAFYITEPQGFDSHNLFVNSACEVVSKLSIYKVFSITQSIEKEIGRLKKSNSEIYTDRIIDIDIILYDDLILQTPELIVPHPRFYLRLFVLMPMEEIAPDIIHPILKKNISELLLELTT